MPYREFRKIEVCFKDGTIGIGRSDGPTAAWTCHCETASPLLERCVPSDHPPHAVCPCCDRTYQVIAGLGGEAVLVLETTASVTVN
jgi:hypothetical protein